MPRYICSPGYRAEITKAKAEKLTKAFDDVVEILLIEETYDYVISNFLELEQTNFQLASRYIALGSFNLGVIQKDRSEVARRIINLLTTARLYIDQTPHRLEGIFGTNEIRENFIRLTHKQYDNDLSYRFVEAFRNYVQHRGLPIHSLFYSSQVVDIENDRRVKHLVAPLILLDEFQGDKRFKQPVLKEMIERDGKRVHALSVLRDYLEGLSAIHMGTRRLLDKKYETSQKYLNDEKSKLESGNVDTNSFRQLGVERLDRKGSRQEERYISLGYFGQIDFLRQKNKNLAGLSNSFVTTEVKLD